MYINKEQNYTIDKINKLNKEQTDEIFRNSKMNEKQHRDIFRLRARDKVLERRIEANKNKNNSQDKEINRITELNIKQEEAIINNTKINQQQSVFFSTDEINVKSKIKTGSLVLTAITVNKDEIQDLDVADKGVVFAKEVKRIRGFINGSIGQVLYIINTGTNGIVIENNAYGDFQKIKLSSNSIQLEKDRGIALIFDGTYWRVFSR